MVSVFVLWATGVDVRYFTFGDTDTDTAPRPRCRLDMPLDSYQSPEPFASRAERILEAEAGLSGVVREAAAPSEEGTSPIITCRIPLGPYLRPSIAMQEYLDQCRSCGWGPQFPAVATLGRKPCG